MVAVLAHALALVRRDKFGEDADPEKCATAALFHDVSEILTGDLPTPVKYFNSEIMNDYKEVERLSKAKLLSFLPAPMQEIYQPLIFEDHDPTTKKVVKEADKLSAYIKCLEELKSGNTEFKKASEQIKETLDSMDSPSLKYFMDIFLPSFSLSLDEQE